MIWSRWTVRVATALGLLGITGGCGARVVVDEQSGSTGSGVEPGSCAACTKGCTLEHVRTSTFPASGGAEISDVAFDSGGSYYVTGFAGGTVDFGGGPLANPGGNTTFVAAFTKEGVHRWSRVFGNANFDGGTSIAVGSQGPVVSGFMSGTADLGGGPISGDSFLLALDPDGNHRWSKGFGAGGLNGFPTVASDADDNVFVAGYGQGPFNELAKGAYLAKLDPSGKLGWVLQAAANEFSAGVAVYGDALYFRFVFAGQTEIGGQTFHTQGSERQLLVARLDSTGTVAWVVSGASSDYDLIAADMAADASGVVVTGVIGGDVDVGNGATHVAGSFLLKRAADGSFAWGRAFGDSNGWGNAVTVDDRGAVTMLAALGQSDFGGGLLTADNGAALARFDACGNHLWSRAVASGLQSPVAVGAAALGPNDAVMVAGGFTGTIDFGGGPHSAPGGELPYLVELAPSP